MTAAAVGDSPLFLLDYALRLLRVLVLIALWRVMLGGNAVAGGMSLAAVLTYTVIAEVFAHQLEVKTTISDAFWQGTIVLRFLRPINLIGQFSAEMAGNWIVHFALFSVPLLALAPLLGVDARPASALAGGLAALSLALGIVVGLAMEVLFATLTVALEQPVWTVENVRTAVATLLSGSVLPLTYYPFGLGEMFTWLPFAAMAWAPLAIYTGSDDPARLIVLQVLWAFVLWALAGYLWRANREKVVGYGG
jgi:ABC-2 type transport system permease protein